MSTTTISPLRQRMIEDMTARKFGPASQRSHIESCERFAAYLKRSPATATPDDVRLFQLDLIESGLIPIPDRFESNPSPASGNWIAAIASARIQGDLEAV